MCDNMLQMLCCSFSKGFTYTVHSLRDQGGPCREKQDQRNVRDSSSSRSTPSIICQSRHWTDSTPHMAMNSVLSKCTAHLPLFVSPATGLTQLLTWPWTACSENAQHTFHYLSVPPLDWHNCSHGHEQRAQQMHSTPSIICQSRHWTDSTAHMAMNSVLRKCTAHLPWFVSPATGLTQLLTWPRTACSTNAQHLRTLCIPKKGVSRSQKTRKRTFCWGYCTGLFYKMHSAGVWVMWSNTAWKKKIIKTSWNFFVWYHIAKKTLSLSQASCCFMF
jgi:hypothetical protein